MNLFKSDLEEICEIRKINYPKNIANEVISYFNRRIESKEW